MMTDDGVGPFLDIFATFTKKKKLGGRKSTFEEAINETGFGIFNVLLIVLSTCGIWSTIFEHSTMYYMFIPTKDNEQNFQEEQTSYLKSIFYVGLICSAFVWGFSTDTFGRKKLLMIGYFLSSFFVFASILIKNKALVITCKFLEEFTMNALQAAMATYLSEFHSSKYRTIIILAYGIFVNVGVILFPSITLENSPSTWVQSPSYGFIGIEWNSKNVYSLICGSFGFITGIIFYCLPESPKYLMAIGENVQAMFVFRMIYRMNTGKSSKTFPVDVLVEERENNRKKYSGSCFEFQAIRKHFLRLKPLVSKRYFGKFVLICFIQLLILQCSNTVKLWIPEISQVIEKVNSNGTSANVCTILDVFYFRNTNHTNVTEADTSSVRNNYVVILFVSLALYLLTGSVSQCFSKKKMLIIITAMAGICCCLSYFSSCMVPVLVLVSLLVAFENVCNSLVLATIIEIFPTTVRTLAILMSMGLARMGSNTEILLPFLSFFGYAPHFFILGSLIIGIGVIALFLPNTENEALK